jgi:GxxExxY protein
MSSYRLLELIPGFLAWATIILIFLLSWLLPAYVAVFIILFDIYWLFKTIFLSFHLRATFKKMRGNLKINWLEKLGGLNRDSKNSNDIRMPQIVEKELSYKLTGIFFRIHREIGRFARERQYGDVLARELEAGGINYRREKPAETADRKSNFIDFVVEDKIAIELKAKSFIEKEDYYQIQRYLKAAKLQLGLIVNFAQSHLKPKRVLNPDFYSRHSDEFVDSNRVSWSDIYHLIILPMYKEPYEVVSESFESLATANYPKDKFIVVLAPEERGGEIAQLVSQKIREKFGNKFFRFLITAHPANLTGEIPGKGSNQTWATRQVKKEIIDVLKIPYENILTSVFDVDTQVPPDYFGRLTYVFLTCKNPQRSSFQPVPLFINNIFQAPALGRVISFSATFWHMMQQSRPERLTTFSSHSMPFKALTEINFWNTNIVSEDSQIFWQCYLYYNGDWRAEPLFYPAMMDANVAPTFWQTLINLYKQQRRWGWGCENIPYMLNGFRRHPRIPFRKKLYWGFNIIEGFHSWATNALIIFTLGWLPIFLGGPAFSITLLSYNLPYLTKWIMNLAMVGIVTSAILSMILLPPKPKWFRWYHYPLYLFQWIFMPFTLIVFGAFPGLEAQTRLMLGGRFRLGFWVTPKQR